MKIAKSLLLCAALFCLSSDFQANAKNIRPLAFLQRKKASDTTKIEPAKTPYEKFINKKEIKKAEGFATIYRSGESILLEIPDSLIGRRVIFSNVITDCTSPDVIVGTDISENTVYEIAETDSMSGVYLYDVDTNWNYNYFYFDEGANIVVDKNDDGTYNFSFHGKAALYVYDDNYNLVKSGSSFDYEYSYTHVAVKVDTQSSLKPCPDGDVEFKTVMSSQYVGLWWGKAYQEKYGADANVFTFGFSSVNGTYTAYLTVVDDNNWTWTGNFGSTSLYCNTPFADGTYNFSKTPAKMTLVPCAYSYVQNGYSGTKCPITGGYIMLRIMNSKYIEKKVV